MSRFKFLAALAVMLGAAVRWIFRRTPDIVDASAPLEREVARIELRGAARLTESKVGGDPYLPPSIPYPRVWNGRALDFLAQINFSEVPRMRGYPRDGILSFFIDGGDELYGMDLDHQTKQRGFRVIYIPAAEITTEKPRASPEPAHEGMSPLGPGTNNVKMHFRRDTESVSSSDYRCPQEKRDAQLDRELLARPGHKIGGYPEFVQSDPRERLDGETFELLFQLDTDGKEGQYDIMWGDAGVGNFFIKPSALAKLDFTDVLYNWDCA